MSMVSHPEGGVSALTPTSSIAAYNEPVTPVLPKQIGPTVERASMRTADLSGSRMNRHIAGLIESPQGRSEPEISGNSKPARSGVSERPALNGLRGFPSDAAR